MNECLLSQKQTFRIYVWVGTVSDGYFWPYFTVKEVLNMAESNFRFVLESGRSECADWNRPECLLLAGSSRSLTLFNGDFGPDTGRSDNIFRGRS